MLLGYGLSFLCQDKVGHAPIILVFLSLQHALFDQGFNCLGNSSLADIEGLSQLRIGLSSLRQKHENMLLSIGQLNLTTALTNEELMLIFSLEQNLINQLIYLFF